MRVYYYKSYSELILILTNNVNLFYIIILNFIINISFTRDLYINKTYDIILILINKFTKYVTYIIIIKNFKINKFINIL